MTIEDAPLEAPMHFTDRLDLWDTVKPYSLLYYPKEDFPRTNIVHSPHKVQIRNMRASNPAPSLDVNGFEVHSLPSKMTYDGFDTEPTIEAVYCNELEQHFMKVLGAKNVRVLDYQRRRKSPTYPYFKGLLPPEPQPSLLTHADLTPDGAREVVKSLYNNAEEIMQSRYQVITAWKPLQLPVRDWPLAICDATTIDRDTDLIQTDIIYPKYLAENYMGHHNPKQKWYWLQDHQPDEILVFKAFDSDGPGSWPCAHGAFPFPGQNENAPGRDSIDTRLLVMYADVEYSVSEP